MEGQGLCQLAGKLVGQVGHTLLLLLGQGLGQISQGPVGFIEGGSHFLAHDVTDRSVDALGKVAAGQLVGQAGEGLDLLADFLPIVDHFADQDSHPGHVHENGHAGDQGQAEPVPFLFQVTGDLIALPDKDQGRDQAQGQEGQAGTQDPKMQLAIGVDDKGDQGAQGRQSKGQDGIEASLGLGRLGRIKMEGGQNRSGIGQHPPLIMQMGDLAQALAQGLQLRAGQELLDGIGRQKMSGQVALEKVDPLLGQGPALGLEGPVFHKTGHHKGQRDQGKDRRKDGHQVI